MILATHSPWIGLAWHVNKAIDAPALLPSLAEPASEAE
jgi:hypothetical protein